MDERTEGAIRTVAIAAALMLVTGYFAYDAGHAAGIEEAPEIVAWERESTARTEAFVERMNADAPSARECLNIISAELDRLPNERGRFLGRYLGSRAE